MALCSFSPNEIIDLAEKYSCNAESKQEAVNSIIKKIKSSSIDTNLDADFFGLKSMYSSKALAADEERFNTNSSYAIRILDKTDSSIRH